MKSHPSTQRHPNQEDKTGRPSYASLSRVNYSAIDSRLGADLEETIHKPQKPETVQIHQRRRKTSTK